MTIQDFMIECRKAVLDFFAENGEEVEVRTDVIVKANDSRRHGLNVRRTDRQIGVNVYQDDLFERLIGGEDIEMLKMEMVAKCVISLVRADMEMLGLMNVQDCFDFDRIRSRLSVRLLDVGKNISYMDDRPYIDVGNGLALIAYINEDESLTSEWKIAITNEHLEHIGCDKEKLLTQALINSMGAMPPFLMKITDAIEEDDPVNILHGHYEPEEGEIYALTNSVRFQGAAALYYPGVMKRIAETIRSGYFAIPSSVHEMIIIPDNQSVDASYLSYMLRNANRHLVDAEDVLSDRVLHYDPEEDELSIAA